MEQMAAQRHTGWARAGRIAVIAVFLLILVLGLLLYDDYGISVDEPMEMWTAQYNYDMLKKLLLNSNSAERDPAADQRLLDAYALRFYGVILQMPLIVWADGVRILTGAVPQERTLYLVRHLYTFLIFYGALICFYRFLKRLTGGRLPALLGVGMLLLCPRIFAHAFFNIKDIPFLSFMVFLFSATERLLSSGKRWTWCLLVALLGAVTVSVRTIGALWLVFTVIAMLVTDAKSKAAGPKGLPRRGFGLVMPYALICCAFPIWLLLMPCSWSNPVSYVLETVKTFSNYVTWKGDALFAGRLVAYNEVPRTYFLTWIGITVPLAYLALSLAGMAAFCRRRSGGADAALCRDSAPAGRTVLAMMLALLATVLGYQFLTTPVVYNGWRHAYFLYPVMVAFAVYALSFLRRACQTGWKRIFRWAAACALAASMLFSAHTILREHPYEYASYNVIGKRVALEFDRDYWKLSNAEALRQLLAMEEGTLKVLCLDGAYEPFMFGQQMLSEAERARLSWWQPLEECDYLLVNCRFLVGTNDLPSAREGFTEIGSVWCGDVKLTSIQKRCTPEEWRLFCVG